nr:copia protein [Tanacetum cinerariifolium]
AKIGQKEWIEAMQEELLQFKMQKVWVLVDLPKGKRAIGSKWVFKNKKNERGITIMNKARLVTQGHTQEEGIDYEEVFSPVARIEAIRLFLAYASFMSFTVYQMDVKSAIIYGTIKEEVYVCQPLGFKDPDYPDKVYKVVKALYGLHQAPKACQDKYVAEILRKFSLTDGKSASIPIDTEKPLLKDPDDEDVDTRYLKGKLHLGLWYPKDSPFNLVAYSDSDYARASLDRKSTTGGCQFLGCRLISWQCKKQTVVATSSTEAEYIDKVCAVRPKLVLLVLIKAQHHISNESPLLGVNTDRCDEDSLALMELMVFLLYVNSVWSDERCCSLNAARSQKSNDVMKLQALIDRKKVIITEDTIRQNLRLDDADGIDCLPNEKIFAELARMGYEKPGLHGMNLVLPWPRLSSALPQMIFLPIIPSIHPLPSHKVFANMTRIGKGFSRVDTPLVDAMLVQQQVHDDVAKVEEDEDDEVSASPTLPSPTPAATPPPPQQEPIPSPRQAKSAQP